MLQGHFIIFCYNYFGLETTSLFLSLIDPEKPAEMSSHHQGHKACSQTQKKFTTVETRHGHWRIPRLYLRETPTPLNGIPEEKDSLEDSETSSQVGKKNQTINLEFLLEEEEEKYQQPAENQGEITNVALGLNHIQ